VAKRYAEGTEVSVEKSRAEIEGLLRKYGATSLMSGMNPTESVVAFEMKARKIMFRLPMPDRNAKEFTHYLHSGGHSWVERNPATAYEKWEQACRSRWRALALAVKAKLEAVAVGITTFEDEFMAHIVMPDGQTVGEHVRPRIASAYESGQVTPLLPGPKS
jgi:hypothetical protein